MLLSQVWKACRDIYQLCGNNRWSNLFFQGRGGTCTHKRRNATKQKTFTPSSFNFFLPNAHITHICTHAHTLSRPVCKTLTVCEVCVCVYESSPAKVQRSGETPNSAVALEAPCLPLPPMLVMWLCIQGNKTRPLPSNIPPPVTTKLNKEPTCMHKRQILAGDFSRDVWKSTV